MIECPIAVHKTIEVNREKMEHKSERCPTCRYNRACEHNNLTVTQYKKSMLESMGFIVITMKECQYNKWLVDNGLYEVVLI